VKKVVAVAVVVVAASVPSPQARSAFPGANGKIAFTSEQSGNFEIDVMNADGSGRTMLASKAIEPAWSPDGSKIAFASDRDGTFQIYVMNADGSGQTRLTKNNGVDMSPAWSPEGTKIVFQGQRNGATSQIYVMNADGSAQAPLTDGTYPDENPAWSPDGRKIAYASYRHLTNRIVVMNADGSGGTPLTGPRFAYLPKWSPDGRKIAYTDYTEAFEVYVMNADGTNQAPITPTSANAAGADWSPDGTRLVFSTSRDGVNQIYVMSADGSGATRLTNNTTRNDTYPAWQPVASADLSLDLAARASGRTRVVTYSINVADAGPSPAAGVVVRDTLPSQSLFVAARPSQGRCTGPANRAPGPRTVVCELGFVGAAGTASIQIDVRFNAKPIPRTLRITDSGGATSSTPDPNVQNNSASVTTTIRLRR
jgi:uncharacterized repeat protein (TIGR01451 family)